MTLRPLLICLTGLAVLNLCRAEAPAGYRVEEISVAYGRPHPDAPPVDVLEGVTVELARDGDVLAAEGVGERVTIRVGDPLGAGTRLTEGALQRILSALVARLNEEGIYGVVAIPDRNQIDPGTREDLRPPDERRLGVVVWLMEVAELRSIAKGTRVPSDEAIMNPRHAGILAHSPLKPDSAPEGRGSLFRKPLLDEYLRRLNRHPGRIVEAALSSSDQPGRVVLDYLVNEERPWFVYGQFSNTGTKPTDEFRERVGFVHNQLFNRDDILSLDYITANLDKANAVFASYSIPIVFPDVLRGRVFGSWGDFDATVDLAALQPDDDPAQPDFPPEQFSGSSWHFGTEATWSPLTLWGASLDLTAGVTMPHYEVVNKARPNAPGSVDLLTPSLVLRLDRATELYGFTASLGYERNLKSISEAELTKLGRLETTDKYSLIRAEVAAQTYLEPFFLGLSNRESWVNRAHAHELSLALRGQYVIGSDLLIPQKEQAIGGFFTVRGYPESAVAGDNTYVANLEYRFHLPRTLRPASEIEKDKTAVTSEPAPTLFGRPFHYRPPRVAARPDWDLILRAFFDYGRVEMNNVSATATQLYDHTLMSAGIGVELQFMRNLNARLDWGYALKDLRTGLLASENQPYRPGLNDTDKGDSRLHFLLTFVW